VTFADPITERRLMASIIAEPGVLEQCDDLEIGDFSDLRFGHVLAAIRRLQACSADIGIDEIDHEIQLEDMSRDKLGAGKLAASIGFWFLADLMIRDFAPYRGHDVLIDHDLWWLRELAERRRNLKGAA
jgi:hypothetical protein